MSCLALLLALTHSSVGIVGGLADLRARPPSGVGGTTSPRATAPTPQMAGRTVKAHTHDRKGIQNVIGIDPNVRVVEKRRNDHYSSKIEEMSISDEI